MKTLKLFTKTLLLLSITGVMLGSCSKGEQGETGPQGGQGDQGIAGPSGSTVLNGIVVPATSVGKTGDFYINTATSTFYGPKTAAGWGTGTAIKGTTGAKGTAGSKILSGTVTPAATIGATGDYYLDKTSYSFYGPKTGTGWGTAISLKGTANVIYSGWNIAKNFRDTTIDNSKLKVADLPAPALSDNILNSGTVQLFLNYGGGVFSMPYTSNAGGTTNTLSYLPRLKHFILTRYTFDNSGAISIGSAIQYRYVIIPGGTAVSVAKKVDINNYEAVKKAYNIPN